MTGFQEKLCMSNVKRLHFAVSLRKKYKQTQQKRCAPNKNGCAAIADRAAFCHTEKEVFGRAGIF